MAIVQHIVYQLGGVVSLTPTERPTNALITIYDGDGSIIVNNVTATVTPVSTTTTNAAAARGKLIQVSNATNITEGMRLKIASPTEWVRVKTISSTNLTLWQPLRETHANNCSIVSTRCYYAVGATNANTFFDGRARWELSSNAVAYTGLECTLYPLTRTATEQDLYDVNPQFAQLLAAEEDPEAALDAAHEYVLEQLGKRGRARVYPMSAEMNRCVALALARLHYLGQSTEAAKTMFERFDRECGEAIASLMANVIPDDDQDGAIEADEQRSARSVLLERG